MNVCVSAKVKTTTKTSIPTQNETRLCTGKCKASKVICAIDRYHIDDRGCILSVPMILPGISVPRELICGLKFDTTIVGAAFH
jgi:hypothetical protein